MCFHVAKDYIFAAACDQVKPGEICMALDGFKVMDL